MPCGLVGVLLGICLVLSPAATATAAGQPAVRVEITHSDADGKRMPVTQIEFALRNDYLVSGANNLLLKARGAGNELLGYRVVLNPDGTLRLELRDDTGKGQPQVLLDNASMLRLVPVDPDKPDNLVDIKRWIKGELVVSNPYRQVMEFQKGNVSGKLSLISINELGMEDYLKGVLPSEMPASWPLEALKAQAVAARSYAVNHVKKLPPGGWIDDTVTYQKYDGYRVEQPRANQAIQATAGEVLTYGGEVITAWFSASNGGYTEVAENVWFSSAPYLKSLEDPYDIREANPHRSWQVTYTREQLQQMLERNKIQVGEITSLTATKRSPSGRVLELQVKGTAGEHTLVKGEIRSILDLKSLLFTVEQSNQVSVLSITGKVSANLYGMSVLGENGASATVTQPQVAVVGSDQVVRTIPTNQSTYTFAGKGYGHGVGMSQYGARFRAEAGQDYRKILDFYYPGSKITGNYNH
jgi:stage II sporulation protein D